MPLRVEPNLSLLADPTRRHIVAMLAIRVMRPSVLALRLDLSRATVSYHLRLLDRAGLVVIHDGFDRRDRFYGLNHWNHGRITAWLAGTEMGLESLDPSRAAGKPPLPMSMPPPRERFETWRNRQLIEND